MGHPTMTSLGRFNVNRIPEKKQPRLLKTRLGHRVRASTAIAESSENGMISLAARRSFDQAIGFITDP